MVDIESKNWHVLTKTRNGTVSIVRNLSLSEARKVFKSLNPWQHIQPGVQVIRHRQDSDIEQIDVLGPDGWDGCMKAASHSYPEMKKAECDGGPNKGRFHISGSCQHCGEYKFEWCDEARENAQ